MVTRKHTTDPYGVVDIHTESIDLLNATEAEYEAFMREDDVGELAGLLDHIERDVVEFWRKEDLPEPAAAHAARAERGTWVGMSWSLWRCLLATRQALESGDLHRAVRFAFLLGQQQAQIALARRQGRNVSAGRKVIQGGERAASEKHAALRPMHTAWIEQDKELSAHIGSQRERAKKIAARWPGQDWNTIWCYLKEQKKKVRRGVGRSSQLPGRRGY